MATHTASVIPDVTIEDLDILGNFETIRAALTADDTAYSNTLATYETLLVDFTTMQTFTATADFKRALLNIINTDVISFIVTLDKLNADDAIRDSRLKLKSALLDKETTVLEEEAKLIQAELETERILGEKILADAQKVRVSQLKIEAQLKKQYGLNIGILSSGSFSEREDLQASGSDGIIDKQISGYRKSILKSVLKSQSELMSLYRAVKEGPATWEQALVYAVWKELAGPTVVADATS